MPWSMRPNDAAVTTCICGRTSITMSAPIDCIAAAALLPPDARCTMTKAGSLVNGGASVNRHEVSPREEACFVKPPDLRVVSCIVFHYETRQGNLPVFGRFQSSCSILPRYGGLRPIMA